MSDSQICAFPGCGPATRLKRGYCGAHYEQHRTGKALTPVRWRWHSRAPEIPCVSLNPVVQQRARDTFGRIECRGCLRWRHIEEFGKDSSRSDSLKDRCKRCVRGPYLLRRYGITVDQYEEMLDTQGGVCAVCDSPDPAGRDLAVDHDHACCPDPGKSCGKCVRGLLCWPCNVGIGHLRDDPKILTAAAAYLAA